MWPYYGSKSNVVKHYPAPRHERLFEPFAGSARYALHYWRHKVLLIDRYPELIEIWKFIQTCSDKEIDRIPHFVRPGQRISDFSFDTRAAQLLFSFIIGYAITTPRITVSDQKARLRPNHINYTLNRIRKDRYKIAHWDIICDDYRNAPNQEGTWYIDPPYQVAGHAYKYADIDYRELASWCLSRKGQIIVCEGAGASWLPFQELVIHRGARGCTTEYLFHLENSPGSVFHPTQLKLF